MAGTTLQNISLILDGSVEGHSRVVKCVIRDARGMDDSAPREALEELGLSKYAAETLIGLQQVGAGTASDIAAVTDVPRSQVYGAIDELEQLGLVYVQDTNPKEFVAVRPSAVGEILQARMDRWTDTAVNTLQAIQGQAATQQAPSETEHVWRVQGLASITQRITELAESADEALHYYVSTPEYLPADLRTTLTTLADGEVSVHLYASRESTGNSQALEPDSSKIPFGRVELPAQVAAHCTRILVVDEQAVLVGVPADTNSGRETCFWSTSDQIAPLLAATLQSVLASSTLDPS